MKNLGFANGWKEEPQQVRKCKELGHKVAITFPNGRYKPLIEYTCADCGYYYYVDSGG